MSFSLNQIPELAPYRPLERIAILNLALKQLTSIQKVSLNIIKLIVFVPLFIFLAQLSPWLAVVGIVMTLLLFSLIIRPVHIYFAKPHWQQAISSFEKSNSKR